MLTSRHEDNRINSIIKDYLDNNRFLEEDIFYNIARSIVDAFNEKTNISIFISLKSKSIKLVNVYEYIEDINLVDDYIKLSEYSYEDLKKDLNCKSNYLLFNNDDLKPFVKSEKFKERILEAFSDYNLSKLNGNFIELDDLTNLNITLNESNLEQKLFAYYKYKIYPYDDLVQSLKKEIYDEIEGKPIYEKEMIIKKVLKTYYTTYNSLIDENYNFHKFLSTTLIENNKNRFDIMIKFLLNIFEFKFNNLFGEIELSNINNRIRWDTIKFVGESIEDDMEFIFNDENFPTWIKESKISIENKMKFLKIVGTNNFDVLFPENAIQTMIKYFSIDAIYNLKYNNNELLKNNDIKKFYIYDLFEDNINNDKAYSITELIKIPNFVETLYITKHTFLKFNLYCSMYKKDIKKIIPPHTKIIFFEDVSDKDFYSKLV